MFSYLDATSGGTLVALLASGAVGFGVAFRMLKQKLGFGDHEVTGTEADTPEAAPTATDQA